MFDRPKMRQSARLITIGTLLTTATTQPLLAQIIPDNTIGTLVNGTQNTPCIGTCAITGGTTASTNLFHSFRQFSLPDGTIADLTIDPAIKNVLLRVTGSGQPYRSTLNGTLQTTSNANIFLLNPNGIFFGPGHKLDLTGSFFATTVNAIGFPDGSQFSATNPTSPGPLLTIKGAPNAFIATQRPGPIGSADTRLRVGAGENLILVGGDMQFDNTQLGFKGYPLGTQFLIGSIATAGVVGLTSTPTANAPALDLIVPPTIARADVTFLNGSKVDLLAQDGGSMIVYARNLNILSESRLEAGIYEGAEGTQAGDITIDATGDVTIADPNSKITNYVQQYGNGNAGDITVTARSLNILNGGQLSTKTSGNGNNGNITINATNVRLDANYQDGGIYNDINEGAQGNGGKILINADTISLDRASDLNSVTFGNGNAGQIDLNTRTLTITRGAKTIVSTTTEGRGGNLTINARESIRVDGYGTDDQGNPRLSDYGPYLLNSQIGAGVFNGSSRAGDIRITTGNLSISDSGQITVNSFGIGRAGDVIINASQAVTVTGRNEEFKEPSAIVAQSFNRGDGGDILIHTGALTIADRAIVAANSIQNSTGKAGNINLTARTIAVEDAAKIEVNSTTSGRAGEIILQTDQLKLRNGGTITAQTSASQGGNITLNVKDILLLRQNSTISTSAGLAAAGGDGGNITINAPAGFLVSLPQSNSDITANAFNGRGGRVTIAANRIYQFTPRSRAELVEIFRTENPTELDAARLSSNDITAIAQGNPSLGGSVNLLTPDTDPSRGLVPLPNGVTDPTDRIDQRCAPNSNVTANQFTVTGAGGLPSRPTDRPSQPNTLARLAQLPSSAPQASRVLVPPTAPIVEAQAATRLANGTIRFSSQSPEKQTFNPIVNCATGQTDRT